VSQTKQQWRTPRKNNYGAIQARAIQPGDSGIFATCNKGREAKCIGELRDLFSEYAEILYGNAEAQDEAGGGVDNIENDIEAEIAGIKKPQTAQLFTPVKLDVQCGKLYLVSNQVCDVLTLSQSSSSRPLLLSNL